MFVKFNDAVTFRVLHMVGENNPAFGIYALLHKLGQAVPVKDVIAKYKGHGILSYKILPNHESLGQGPGL